MNFRIRSSKLLRNTWRKSFVFKPSAPRPIRKRQRTAALQKLRELRAINCIAERLGVRQSSAAFTTEPERLHRSGNKRFLVAISTLGELRLQRNPKLQITIKGILECVGRAKRRHRFGFRTATPAVESKAPSPLCSAGAIQNLEFGDWNLELLWNFYHVQEVHVVELGPWSFLRAWLF